MIIGESRKCVWGLLVLSRDKLIIDVQTNGNVKELLLVIVRKRKKCVEIKTIATDNTLKKHKGKYLKIVCTENVVDLEKY